MNAILPQAELQRQFQHLDAAFYAPQPHRLGSFLVFAPIAARNEILYRYSRQPIAHNRPAVEDAWIRGVVGGQDIGGRALTQ